jgi:hypothetical protein
MSAVLPGAGPEALNRRGPTMGMPSGSARMGMRRRRSSRLSLPSFPAGNGWPWSRRSHKARWSKAADARDERIRLVRYWLRLSGRHGSAGCVLAGQDEQGAQHGGGLAGVHAQAGQDPPVLEVAEAVSGGARAADCAWLACPWAGVSFAVRVDLTSPRASLPGADGALRADVYVAGPRRRQLAAVVRVAIGRRAADVNVAGSRRQHRAGCPARLVGTGPGHSGADRPGEGESQRAASGELSCLPSWRLSSPSCMS